MIKCSHQNIWLKIERNFSNIGIRNLIFCCFLCVKISFANFTNLTLFNNNLIALTTEPVQQILQKSRHYHCIRS